MFVIIFLGFILNANIFAENKDSALIAAVVNQHAITERELDLRIDFAIATLNMPNTKESKESMRHQVLQNLITEKLQETAADGVKISDTEIDKSLETMAKDNGMTVTQMQEKFKSMGIKIDTLKSRVRSQIVWARLVRQLYQSQIRVSESEVQKEKERIEKDLNTDQYELVEIILPIDEKLKTKSKQDADRLYAQLNQPMTNFRLVAQQFGAQSGYVGWRSVKQIDTSIKDSIVSMRVGSITRPIEDKNSYRIIKLLDKRMAGQGSYNSRKIVTAAARVMLPEEMSEENVAALEEMVGVLKSSKGCGELQRNAGSMPAEVSISEKQPIGALPEALQAILDKATVGEPIGPFQDGNTVNVIMLCSVEAPAKEILPTDKDIKENLEQKEFSKHATRLLNKITATARITIIEKDDSRNNFIKKVK
jgi:peptidyl-prolyl cis-trans isomerase SurA